MAEFNGYRKRKKICQLCAGKPLDYKSEHLKKYVGETGRILPRRITGTCLKHQGEVRKHVQRARIIGLLPFVNK